MRPRFAPLKSIRTSDLPTDGKLSVMAHSMGNVVLAEALYKNEATRINGKKLVDTAIMSQAAISSAYFSASPALPSIYKTHAPITFEDGEQAHDPVQTHIDERTVYYAGPQVTEYKGFRPQGANLDVIGGATPRFRDISKASEKLLNYYNPADYALASWKLVQMFKPTSRWTNGVAAWDMTNWIDTGPVVLEKTWEAAYNWLFPARAIPGFAESEYDIRNLGGGEYKIIRKYTGGVVKPEKELTVAQNVYEMFAFGASSIVSAIGDVPDMTGLSGVFGGSVNLRNLTGTTKFDALKPGHSAQFLHSYQGVKPYWDQVRTNIGG